MANESDIGETERHSGSAESVLLMDKPTRDEILRRAVEAVSEFYKPGASTLVEDVVDDEVME